MALITHFRATTLWKAFLLNSLLISFNAAISIYVFYVIDRYLPHLSEGYNLLITLIVSFTITLGSYLIFFYTFNFGGGMLTAKKSTVSLN